MTSRGTITQRPDALFPRRERVPARIPMASSKLRTPSMGDERTRERTREGSRTAAQTAAKTISRPSARRPPPGVREFAAHARHDRLKPPESNTTKSGFKHVGEVRFDVAGTRFVRRQCLPKLSTGQIPRRAPAPARRPPRLPIRSSSSRISPQTPHHPETSAPRPPHTPLATGGQICNPLSILQSAARDEC